MCIFAIWENFDCKILNKGNPCVCLCLLTWIILKIELLEKKNRFKFRQRDSSFHSEQNSIIDVFLYLTVEKTHTENKKKTKIYLSWVIKTNQNENCHLKQHRTTTTKKKIEYKSGSKRNNKSKRTISKNCVWVKWNYYNYLLNGGVFKWRKSERFKKCVCEKRLKIEEEVQENVNGCT